MMMIKMQKGYPYNGFTLVELMIVLVIIGLMSALVGPRFGDHFLSASAKTAARHIASILRYTRNLAVTDNAFSIVVFNTTDQIVEYHKVPSGEQADGLPDQTDDSPVEKERQYRIPNGLRIMSLQTDDSGKKATDMQIVFYPSGNSSGGTVTVVDRKNRKYEIQVDMMTGDVSISS